jgi:hypothetical protein
MSSLRRSNLYFGFTKMLNPVVIGCRIVSQYPEATKLGAWSCGHVSQHAHVGVIDPFLLKGHKRWTYADTCMLQPFTRNDDVSIRVESSRRDIKQMVNKFKTENKYSLI